MKKHSRITRKLSEIDCVEIFRLNNLYFSQGKISKLFNISQGLVSDVLNKKNAYSDIESILHLKYIRHKIQEQRRGFTKKEVIQIKEMYCDGSTISEIAKMFDCEYSIIYKVVNLETYREVNKSYRKQ